jgi:hypothetical protein
MAYIEVAFGLGSANTINMAVTVTIFPQDKAQ